MRRDRCIAETRRDRPGENEGAHERGRADEDPLPQREHAPRESKAHARLSRLQLAEDDDDERCAHPQLRDRRPPRRPLDPPAEPVDEEHLEHDVRDVSRDQDDERRSKISDPAQVTLAAQCEERRREADCCDAKVRDRLIGRLALAAHQRDERFCKHREEHGDGDAERERKPDRLRSEAARRLLLPRSAGASDLGRRPVLEEVEDGKKPAEQRERDAECGELRSSEVADDRGVDEEVERLGRERAQRGKREPQDLAVVPRPEPHAPRVASIVAS